MRHLKFVLVMLICGCASHPVTSSSSPIVMVSSLGSLVVVDDSGNTMMKCQAVYQDTVKECTLKGSLDDTVSVLVKIIHQKEDMVYDQDQQISILTKLLEAKPVIAVAPRPPFGRKM